MSLGVIVDGICIPHAVSFSGVPPGETLTVYLLHTENPGPGLPASSRLGGAQHNLVALCVLREVPAMTMGLRRRPDGQECVAVTEPMAE